ncbi:MAG: hypothetical protein JWM47_4164 [Acidimicrobiales bacterium]|nr:hypothetical protein [Acidimicrobiales bacterium]
MRFIFIVFGVWVGKEYGIEREQGKKELAVLCQVQTPGIFSTPGTLDQGLAPALGGACYWELTGIELGVGFVTPTRT